jgi:hypothetical protein
MLALNKPHHTVKGMHAQQKQCFYIHATTTAEAVFAAAAVNCTTVDVGYITTFKGSIADACIA